MKFLVSNVRVYPSSNANNKSKFKLNSERNLTNWARSHVRDKVISGWNTSSGMTFVDSRIVLSSGVCILSGYRIELENSVDLGFTSSYEDTSSTPNWVYLELTREGGGDRNLIGIETREEGDTYLGVSIDISDKSLDDLLYDLEGVEYLLLGYIIKEGTAWKYYPLKKSKTSLRAQDIYIEGSIAGDTYQGKDKGDIHSQDSEDPYATYLNPSTTLDEYLANMIISDGQFE